jgi:hypothetical protein
MEPQVPLDQLGHQSIKSAAARGNQLQDFLAFALSLERPFNRLDLALDAPDA